MSKIKLLYDSWENLPLGLFQEINEIGNENIDEDTKALKVVALLSNSTLEEIENLPISEATKLISQTAFLYTPIPKIKPEKNLNLNGKEYRRLGKREEMTAGQFIEYQGIFPYINKMLPEFMSLFIIPKGYKYGDDYDKNEVIEDIREHLSVVEALSLADFFINAYRKSWMRTLLFYEARMKTISILNKDQRKIALQTEEVLKGLRKQLNILLGCRS